MAVKVTVNLSEEDVEALKEIAARRGITLTESIRRAIAMERFVDEAQVSGAKILIEEPDKSVRQLVIR